MTEVTEEAGRKRVRKRRRHEERVRKLDTETRKKDGKNKGKRRRRMVTRRKAVWASLKKRAGLLHSTRLYDGQTDGQTARWSRTAGKKNGTTGN